MAGEDLQHCASLAFCDWECNAGVKTVTKFGTTDCTSQCLLDERPLEAEVPLPIPPVRLIMSGRRLIGGWLIRYVWRTDVSNDTVRAEVI